MSLTKVSSSFLLAYIQSLKLEVLEKYANKDRSELLIELTGMIMSVIGTILVATREFQLWGWLLYVIADVLLIEICRRNKLLFMQLMYCVYLAVAFYAVSIRLW